MKYKDYLILPVLLMFLIYASCAYVAKADSAMTNNSFDAPDAKISPEKIVWGGETEEYWYAEGARGTTYFFVTDDGSEEGKITFYDSSVTDRRSAALTESSYVITGMHLKCTNHGVRYDLIFPDEMTAYDLLSGTTFQRADYDQMKSQMTSGRFVNENDPQDYYVLKADGKGTQYCGDRVFRGKWSFTTAETISLFQKTEKQQPFEIVYDDFGNLSGFISQNSVYTLCA